MTNRPSEFLPVLVFGLLCLVWGSVWLVIKVGLEFLPPLHLAGIQFGIASGLLLICALAMKIEFPIDRNSWRVMIFLALTQIALPYGLSNWGQQYITAGLAALLFATANLFVILFARFLMPSELLTASKVLGILVSFIGVVIVFSGELLVAANSFWGGVALIIGAGSTGCAFVVAKKYSTSIKPVINVIVQTGIGALILLVTAAFFERQVPSQLNITSLLIIAYLSVAGSALPFVGMYWLFTRMEVTRVSLFNFIIPIVAVIFGWLILGERVGPNLLIGGALILVGVVLANQRDKKSLKT